MNGRGRTSSPIAAAAADRLLVVDSRRLRQACLVRLLEEWASANRLHVLAISSPQELNAGANCSMIILNVGGASVLEQAAQFWIRLAKTTLMHVPLVVVSEREDGGEIRAAFAGGAKGYIVTSLDLPLAFEALTFLHRGGSFFPPSAVFEETSAENPPCVPAASDRSRALVRISARIAHRRATEEAAASVVDATEDAPPAFTPRQREVLEQLSAGKPNKLIARELNLSLATVKVHVRQIMRKVGAANRTQAVLSATQLSASLARRSR